jgi:hypothetical protein
VTASPRQRLTFKQKVLVFLLLAFLDIPACIFILGYSHRFSARQGAAVGAVNLVIVLPLVIFISEKWIRKMK